MRRGVELGFLNGKPLVYSGTEPVAIDAQAGKGKLTRFLGVNLVSLRTSHLTKIITDPKDGELAWICWKTLERQGYAVRFINAGDLYGYKSESFNINTRLLEMARIRSLSPLLWEAAYDAASFLAPIDSEPRTRWIGQGVRTMFAAYNVVAARFPDERRRCTPGGLCDFFFRAREDVAESFGAWARMERFSEYRGIFEQVAGWTASPDQWNAYNSVIVESLQAYQPHSAGRRLTESNSFEPADMKKRRTALFIMGSARSHTSRNFVGAMTAAIIERFADAPGDLRALVYGEEWGQLYVSNFEHMLTLYREGGVNFLGVFQNAGAQIEARYGKELSRIWKKAVAHTLYRGLPDEEALREIEYLSGRKGVMLRGFSVSNAQVNGSGDNWGEQSRPLLQVEDVREVTGGERALLHSRDVGFTRVDLPNFWERREVSGMLRDVRRRPHIHAHLRQELDHAPMASGDDLQGVMRAIRARHALLSEPVGARPQEIPEGPGHPKGRSAAEDGKAVERGIPVFQSSVRDRL